MKRRSFLLWSCALALPASTTGFAQAPVSDLESEVYTALLNRATEDHKEGKLPTIVVATNTVSLKESAFGSFVGPGSFAESIRQRIPEAGQRVVEDLVGVGETAGTVRLKVNALRQGLKVQLAPEAKLREIFNDENNRLGSQWTRFKAVYKGANGVLSFSRVGSDPQSGEALLLSSFECGALCGSGFLVLLRRQWSVWNIIKERQVWVS